MKRPVYTNTSKVRIFRDSSKAEKLKKGGEILVVSSQNQDTVQNQELQRENSKLTIPHGRPLSNCYSGTGAVS
jgi:hypothetical protein